jgi:hypothetical protein
MHKTALVIAAIALAACSRTETESHGEVVDTLDTPNLDSGLGVAQDSVILDSLTDTALVKKPFGRKPVEMKKLDTTIKQ